MQSKLTKDTFVTLDTKHALRRTAALLRSGASCEETAAAQLDKAAEEIETLLHVIALAYGHLWHVNNEPGTPNQHPPERAAYDARRILRNLLTNEQRGEAINRVRECLGYCHGAASACGDATSKAEARGGDVYVGNDLIMRFDERSNDYAYAHARDYARQWNERNGKS